MTPEFEKFWTTTKHAEGVYGPPPLRGCRCIRCLHTRCVRGLCGNCGNLGSSAEPCWTCGRGCYWLEWGTTTDDVALGA